jgi:glycosyltransferase involved in cell wall biosynthesis
MESRTQSVSTSVDTLGHERVALRLAVFGWVRDGHGSVGSAHFELCRALLAAGHRIDFYAEPSFIPSPGYDSPGFDYVPIEVELRREVDPDRFPAAVRGLFVRIRGERRARRYREHAMIVARSRHAVRPYDAVLFLGTPPGSTIDGIPTVVWPQGAPQNELDAIRGLAGPVKRVSGRSAYLKVRLYYEIKDRLVWGWTRRHRLVLASNAARLKAIDFGVAEDRVCVAPYPVDLTRFKPHSIPSGPVQRVLCFGRLDPRKRLDLLVDAVAILADKREDFEVDVIGKDGYIPGWSTFVENAGRTLPISYTGAVPQAEILERLREADVVVQPSEHEEFGSAVAEALACGIPVVTGPTNGTGEYTPDDGSARFDRYEPQSLADAIERALALSRDPSARSACRTAAGAFAAELVADKVASFIRQARE